MSFDRAVFEAVQGLTGNPFVDQLMMFFAEFLVLAVPLSLVVLWFQGMDGKEDSLFTAYSTVLGIIVSYLMGLVYAHENPSASYETIVSFQPENAFPSQHTTAVFAAALPLLKREREKLGWTVMIAGLFTGFSRVYIGEHWPVDIIGAAFAAIFGLTLAYFSWDKVRFIWEPFLEVSEKVEKRTKGFLS